MTFETIVGLEIHLQLNSESKLFSSGHNLKNSPNINIDEFCVGYPGFLPRVNEKVIESAIKLCSVLHMNINKTILFDRKKYFYSDLPRGYQITQHRFPIGTNGYLKIDDKVFRIKELHIEEDTAKQIHKADFTYLDYNRAGIPLLEIVFESDIRNPNEAKNCVNELLKIVRFLNISDCKLEDGSMRCDVNVSLRPTGSSSYNEYVEIKNLNSVKNIGLAIEIEAKRQTEIYLNHLCVTKCTYRYDEDDDQLILMRDKFNEDDYSYLPETNIGPIVLTDDYIKKVTSDISFDADIKFLFDIGLNKSECDYLISDFRLFDLFKKSLNGCENYLTLFNLYKTVVQTYLNSGNDNTYSKINFEHITLLSNLISSSKISFGQGKIIFDKMMSRGGNPIDIYNELFFDYISDEKIIIDKINTVLDSNEDSIRDIKNGKNHLLRYLMGLIIKAFNGKVDPKLVSSLLEKELSKR